MDTGHEKRRKIAPMTVLVHKQTDAEQLRQLATATDLLLDDIIRRVFKQREVNKNGGKQVQK